jgi:hypothetical protein
MAKNEKNVVNRAVALLLGLGGAAGVGISVWMYSKILMQTGLRLSAAAALFGTFIVVYAWSTWVGVDLWRGKQQALKWAAVLLALQIPNIIVPGFAYQFYTGATLYLSWDFGDAVLRFDFELASAAVFQISSKVEDSVLGLNLVALAALVWVLYFSRQLGRAKALSLSAEQS